MGRQPSPGTGFARATFSCGPRNAGEGLRWRLRPGRHQKGPAHGAHPDRPCRPHHRRQQGARPRHGAEIRRGGADVAILARDAEALDAARRTIEATGKGKVAAFACDVTRPDEIARAYEQVMGALGRVDILVNNAGRSRTGKFLEIDDAVWQEDLDLKLFAAIRLARLVLPQMSERRWGRILNVLAIVAKAPRAGSAPTSVSRAAGMALTKVLAGEGAPHNVLVNALLVGSIVSDQVVRRHRAEGSNETLADYIRARGPASPSAAWARPRNSPISRSSSPPMPAPT